MDRDQLMQAFREETSASSQAKNALAAGADFEVWPGKIPATRLHHTYARRLRISQELNRPSMGFEEAVASLAASGDRELLIGYIDDRKREGYYYQLFLSSDLTRVIGCIGVKNPS